MDLRVSSDLKLAKVSNEILVMIFFGFQRCQVSHIFDDVTVLVIVASEYARIGAGVSADEEIATWIFD